MRQYPPCTCGQTDWAQGWGQFGPTFQFTSAECRRCGNHLADITRDYWRVVLIGPNGFDMDPYANTTMAIQARDYHERLRAIQKKVEFAREHEWKTIVGQPLPEGVEVQDTTGLDAALMADHILPHQMVNPPNPYRVPEGLTAYVWRGQWDPVNPDDPVTMPEDPLRMHWMSYWNEVFEAVAGATGQAIARVEISNRYHDDVNNSEPWWKYPIGPATFIVGPRKRVIHIQFSTPHAVDVAQLRDVTTADRVTYTANGGYLSRKDMVSTVIVHAWTKEKAIEYLTLAIQAVTKEASQRASQ